MSTDGKPTELLKSQRLGLSYITLIFVAYVSIAPSAQSMILASEKCHVLS